MAQQTSHSIATTGQPGIILISLWDEFCRLRTVVCGERTTDAIHDLRVASRRLRAAIALFTPCLPGKRARSFSRKIRTITRGLGRLRNIDEAMLYFEVQPASLPHLLDALGKGRKKALRDAVTRLKALPVSDMDRRLQKMAAQLALCVVDDVAGGKLKACKSGVSDQQYQRVIELLPQAVTPDSVEGRHRLRIAIKKWRYRLETIAGVAGQDYGETLETLKTYQTILGKLNDMVAFAALCDDLKLSRDEREAVRSSLAGDAAIYFETFIRLVSQQPLHNLLPR